MLRPNIGEEFRRGSVKITLQGTDNSSVKTYANPICDVSPRPNMN
jgi:hypothetical protein